MIASDDYAPHLMNGLAQRVAMLMTRLAFSAAKPMRPSVRWTIVSSDYCSFSKTEHVAQDLAERAEQLLDRFYHILIRLSDILESSNTMSLSGAHLPLNLSSSVT